MSVLTLGGLRIMREHRTVANLRSRAAEAILVYLVCQGRPLAREWLAEFLWPDRGRETSLVNLRVALFHLNKAFAPNLVVTRQSVTVKDDDAPYLDSAEFERLLRDRRPEDALDLYHGDFLSGFYLSGSAAFEAWASSERERLHELALSAYEDLTDRHVAAGRPDEAVRVARGLLRLEPYHEPTQRLLLRLLAQSGRRQAGIEGFEQYRVRLLDELGLEPDAESLALLESIRHGAVESLDISRTIGSDAPIDVPRYGTPFLGRHAELAALQRRLARADCRLVTIVGPGGMGKTRLAIEAALRASPDYPDGVCFVPLAGVMAPEAIVPAVAHGLSLTLPPANDARAGLAAYLRTKKLLLVLDNFEQLVDGAPLLLEMVHQAPTVTMLVTSRERLGLSEEWLLPLSGLKPDDSAVELFVQRASRAAPDLDPRVEDEAIRELCRLVEGMPLAIELAASWAGIMGCAAIVREVGASLDFLTANVRDLPERHRSIRSLFDASWNLLGLEARTVLMHLSVFRGGFTAVEAQTVAGATLGDLRALIDTSLVQADRRGRFALHELIRQYAAERLATAGEAEATAARHFGAFLALAEQAEPQLFGADQPAWLTRLELEWDNFRAALTWGFGGGQPTDALVRMVVALSWFWRRSAGHEARAWLERALGLEGIRAAQRAALLSHAGHVDMMLVRRDVAAAHLEESLALWRALGLLGEHDAARTRCSLAMVHQADGRLDDAAPLLDEALEVFTSTGNEWWTAFALGLQGKGALHAGDYERAEEGLSRSLAIFRRIGNRWGLALISGTAAKLYLDIGSLHEARVAAEEARTLLIEIGQKHVLAWVYTILGDIAWAEGRVAETERHYHAAIATNREIGQDDLADHLVAVHAARQR